MWLRGFSRLKKSILVFLSVLFLVAHTVGFMVHVADKSGSNSTLKMIVSRQKLFILFAFLAICLYITLLNPASYRGSRSFVVDYENDIFLKDGTPFDFVSGSLHYFRVPHQLWHDRLLKLRASGINVVSTYVAWNVHEPHEGVFNFAGDADLVKFVKTAQSLDLLVNIRPGPYICAEWDNGGIPYFVLGHPTSPIKLRSSDERYLAHVKRYYDVLLPKLKPLLYRNDGPIILAQIENEYGSDLTCDHEYKKYLYNLMKEHLGSNDVVYYTADGWDMHHLICGPIHDSNVLTTINFGTKTEHHDAYYRMRGFQKKGPLVNSEFYPGWLDHWSEPHQCRDTGFVNSQFIKMLVSKLGKVYVNFYMFFGGTNFAFYAGANHNAGKYQPDPTTYDYDAPMSEAGDMTYKYQVLQSTIAKYRSALVHPSFPAEAKNSTKKGYGWVDLTEVLEFGRLKSLATCHHERTKPKTFSQLKQDLGFVLYEINEVQGSEMDVLKITDPRDSVSVFVDNYYVGTIFRKFRTYIFMILLCQKLTEISWLER
eukprot:sb/3463713/